MYKWSDCLVKSYVSVLNGRAEYKESVCGHIEGCLRGLKDLHVWGCVLIILILGQTELPLSNPGDVGSNPAWGVQEKFVSLPHNMPTQL